MDISFIIVNYKSVPLLKRCIASIFSHAPAAKFEIVVVNNDEMPLEDIPGIRMVHNGKNSGFASACNTGAKEAEGKVLFFLNPDTELMGSNIEAVTRSLNDPSVGIAAPCLTESSGSVQPWSAGCEITLLDIIRNNLGYVKSKEIWTGKSSGSADWVSGAALAISKDLFSQSGGFDEKFFMYFEDADLCRRIRMAGKKIRIMPETQVLHLGGRSFLDEKEQKRQYYSSQDYYFKKHFGPLSAFLLKFLRKMSLFLR